MKTLTVINIAIVCCFMTYCEAQTTPSSPTREIGVSFTGLNNFGFSYKKQKGENKYYRFSLPSLNLSVGKFGSANMVGSITLGVSFGKEKRKAINEKLNFVKGWELSEYINTASIISKSNATTTNFSTRLGLVLGFQYTINEKFNLGIETIPGIALVSRASPTEIDFNSINIGFDSNKVALNLMYKF